jgi:membrane-associated phospholipid phosphatase
MREIPAHSHGYQGFLVASAISDALGPLLVSMVTAVGGLAWLRLRRRDLLMYPSGHLAIATAVAVTVMLVVRAGTTSARLERTVATLAVLFLLVAAWARLAETAHSLSDVVGGVATGMAVALGTALAVSAWSVRRGRPHRPSSMRRDDVP